MKKTIAALLSLSFIAGLTACQTMAGFGADVEKVGEKIQGAAKK